MVWCNRDAEIRSLDSDMQTLVYENYNKFISATETIREVCACAPWSMSGVEKVRFDG